MPDIACTILLGMTILSVKHVVGDYFLQTAYQFQNKGTYGHPGGILHSAIQSILTLPLFLVLAPPTMLFGAAIIVAEFIVHYHLDWTKEQLVKRYELEQANPWFWHLFGLDQLGHMLTYIVIIAILIR